MATLNYYLDRRSVKADGTHPLKISLNTRSGSILVSIGIYLQANQWDAANKVVIRHPRRLFLNSFLSDTLLNAEQLILEEQRRQGSALSKVQMKNLITSLFRADRINDKTVYTVFGSFINDSRKRVRTQELYSTTWKKIEGFSGAYAATLHFEDITVGWLEKFDEWLTTECPSVNARAIHLRNLRAVFNAAIDNEITSHYPFRKFKIKRVPTRKRALTVGQIRMLRSCDLQPWQKRYVDMFLLMFYLMGINAADLFCAKPSQLVNGRLEYQRRKTGTLYSVKVEPEAMEIINKYRGKRFLLSVGDTVKNYKDFLKRMNMCLSSLIPGCSSYYARHTSATLAAELQIPLDTIAHMLGHTDQSRRVTLVYIDYNMELVDIANRKVLDWVIYNKK